MSELVITEQRGEPIFTIRDGMVDFSGAKNCGAWAHLIKPNETLIVFRCGEYAVLLSEAQARDIAAAVAALDE